MAAAVEGGNDGEEKQVDARGSGNREGDWESGSQSASGGQGGRDGQEGARGHRQAGGCVEGAVAEDDEAVEEGAAIGESFWAARGLTRAELRQATVYSIRGPRPTLGA